MNGENEFKIRNSIGCSVCGKEINGNEFDSFMVRYGRVFRFCKHCALILDLAAVTVAQIKQAKDEADEVAEKLKKEKKRMGVAK